MMEPLRKMAKQYQLLNVVVRGVVGALEISLIVSALGSNGWQDCQMKIGKSMKKFSVYYQNVLLRHKKKLPAQLRKKAKEYMETILCYEGERGEPWFDLWECRHIVPEGLPISIMFAIWLLAHYPETGVVSADAEIEDGFHNLFEQISEYYVSQGLTHDDAWLMAGQITLEWNLSERREGRIRDCISDLEFTHITNQ